VEGIKNYEALYEKLKYIMAEKAFQIKLMNGDNMKINVADEESYRRLTRMLLEETIPWHSYENKQNRPTKVMVKRLHSSCKPEKIVEELCKRGYKATGATNKLKWKTKEPLNMFMLEFRQDEDINKIFGITDILGTRVEIQPIRKSKMVPQCKRCQAYGHTQGYCAKEPRCVKCTGKHFTRDCTKPKDVPPKCVHCGKNHPANYRGCLVAKEMQKLKNKLMSKPSLPQRPQRERQLENNNRERAQEINNIQPYTRRTFAQVTAGSTNSLQIRKQQNDPNQQILQIILNKLDKQEQMFKNFDERLIRLEYSAKGAIPKERNGQ
jgi:hypothetical protein